MALRSIPFPLVLVPAAAGLALAFCWTGGEASAGPPYTTDDPEPVAYRHWEVYLATTAAKSGPAWSGTGPQIEINYGAARDLQLHVIAPLAFTASADGVSAYGYGDTEIGAKVRFVHEGTWVPQVGLFTLVEVPTGSSTRGLGTGHTQLFLPIWAQKTFGPWTTYGGGGIWIEGLPGHHDYGFLGWHLERKLGEHLSLGAEAFHTTEHGEDAPAETRFDLGAVANLGELHHLLFSAGRGIQGPNRFQGYLAYQLTFGPKAGREASP